jgi:hypothetical protein
MPRHLGRFADRFAAGCRGYTDSKHAPSKLGG